MRSILRVRPLRLVFTANVISMMGSGMNSAAVMWFVLQATHSEVALGMLVVLQTIPSMLMLPFSGVIIDREDRRHLVMLLDAARALIILTVAFLALTAERRGVNPDAARGLQERGTFGNGDSLSVDADLDHAPGNLSISSSGNWR